MRPKARGLAQHGGPPGWVEKSDPASVISYVMDGPYHLSFPHPIPVALTGAAQLLLYYKCTQPSAMSYVTQRRHGLVLLLDPCLLSGDNFIEKGYLCKGTSRVHLHV
jgi:hypothetical protein